MKGFMAARGKFSTTSGSTIIIKINSNETGVNVGNLLENTMIDSKSTILVYRDKGIQNELPPIFEQNISLEYGKRKEISANKFILSKLKIVTDFI